MSPSSTEQDSSYFAHDLCELQAPFEVNGQVYSNAWNTYKVDRYFGQVVSDKQKHHLFQRIHDSPMESIPPWAYALIWFFKDLPTTCYAELGWDFNLSAECAFLKRYRNCGTGGIEFDKNYGIDLIKGTTT